MMPNLKKVGMLALAVALAQALLSGIIYPMFEKTTNTLFSVEPASGIGGTQVGDKVLGFLTGYLPFDFGSYLTYIAIYIGAFAIIWAGLWVYNSDFIRSNLYTGKSMTGRIFAILLYGHIFLYAVLYVMKSNVPGIALNLLIGLSVNLILVATLVSISASKLRWPRM